MTEEENGDVPDNLDKLGADGPKDGEDDCDDCNLVTEKSLELHFSDKPVMSASIPIQWCLTRELVQYFNEHCVTKMALIVRPVGRSLKNTRCESRKIVNINDMMSYIDFKYPGENHVVAIPLYPGGVNVRFVLTRAAADWETYIFSKHDKEDGNYPDSYHPVVCKGELALASNIIQLTFKGEEILAHEKVDMPGGCFAPEPSEAEKNWVNFFFRDPALDQCDFRRRRLLAYSVQPILIIALMEFRLLIAILMTGMLIRKVNWKPIYQPTIHETDDVYINTDDKVFIYGDLGDEYRNHRRYIICTYILINPLVLILLTSLSLIFNSAWLTVPIMVYLLIMLCMGVFQAGAFIKKVEDARPRPRPKPKAEAKPKRVEAPPMAIDEFTVCTGAGFVPMKQLPKSKKTIKLKFLDLKNKICIPFQG